MLLIAFWVDSKWHEKYLAIHDTNTELVALLEGEDEEKGAIQACNT